MLCLCECIGADVRNGIVSKFGKVSGMQLKLKGKYGGQLARSVCIIISVILENL